MSETQKKKGFVDSFLDDALSFFDDDDVPVDKLDRILFVLNAHNEIFERMLNISRDGKTTKNEGVRVKEAEEIFAKGTEMLEEIIAERKKEKEAEKEDEE